VKSLRKKNNDIPEGFLSSREVAELFNVHPENVNIYCRNGILTGAKKFKIGKINKWFIPKETINNMIAERTDNPSLLTYARGDSDPNSALQYIAKNLQDLGGEVFEREPHSRRISK
jgi:hypothetical protein